ncbi:MAG: hypothetical protein ABSG62_16905 [Terracidiphilus sp.]
MPAIIAIIYSYFQAGLTGDPSMCVYLTGIAGRPEAVVVALAT